MSDLFDQHDSESSMDDWGVEHWKGEGTLVDKSAFTKMVADEWDKGLSRTKFANYTPHWQRVMIAFAKRVVQSGVKP